MTLTKFVLILTLFFVSHFVSEPSAKINTFKCRIHYSHFNRLVSDIFLQCTAITHEGVVLSLIHFALLIRLNSIHPTPSNPVTETLLHPPCLFSFGMTSLSLLQMLSSWILAQCCFRPCVFERFLSKGWNIVFISVLECRHDYFLNCV